MPLTGPFGNHVGAGAIEVDLDNTLTAVEHGLGSVPLTILVQQLFETGTESTPAASVGYFRDQSTNSHMYLKASASGRYVIIPIAGNFVTQDW